MGCTNSCTSGLCKNNGNLYVPEQSDNYINNNNLIKERVKQKKIKNAKQNYKENSYEKSVLKIIKSSNKDLEDKDHIDQVLSKHFIMHSLCKAQRIDFIKQISLCSIDEGKILFKEKSIGCYFYIIQSGQVELTIKNKYIKTIKEWESFGELALVHNAKRSGTVIAIQPTTLWCIDNKKLKSFLLEIKNKHFEEQQRFFTSVPILNIIDNQYKSMICSHMVQEKYLKGSTIITEGDPGKSMYIIKEGEAECLKSTTVVRMLTKGDFFGDKSILTKSARTMTIKAKTDIVAYCLSVSLFKEVMSENYRNYLLINFIKYAFLSCGIEVDSEMIKKIFHLFQLQNYQMNEVVFKKEYDKSTSLAIIIEGNLKDSSTSQLIPVSKGSILFKEFVFPVEGKTETCDISRGSDSYSAKILTNNIIADPDCLLLIATIRNLTTMLQMNLNAYFDRCKLLCSLGKIPLFKPFPLKSLEHIVSVINIEHYHLNDIVINEGEESSKFYIIKQGQVDVFKEKIYLRTMNEYEYFGEKSLVIKDKCPATFKAKSQRLIIYSIDKVNFHKIITGENMMEFLSQQIIYQDNQIELEDLETINVLGKGSYGSVNLVKNKQNYQKYALKGIEKTLILHQNICDNVTMEKRVLLQIDHPFIIKLVKTLKDEEKIYFLLEYIEGKELFDVIREIGLLQKDEALFYCCSLYLTIAYLHQNGIIHRDIKPENVMIRKNGYIKLIDFGTAKVIKDKTDTIIGTPQYMAPEVIMGKSYSFSADYWSIAICLYEFMCGEVPFAGDEEDMIRVYDVVLNGDLIFPHFIIDEDFKSVMRIMLNKKILKRYSSFDMIKIHPFFYGFNWDALINMTKDVPYKPSLSQNTTKIGEGSEFEESNIFPSSKNVLPKEQEMKFQEWYNDF